MQLPKLRPAQHVTRVQSCAMRATLSMELDPFRQDAGLERPKLCFITAQWLSGRLEDTRAVSAIMQEHISEWHQLT